MLLRSEFICAVLGLVPLTRFVTRVVRLVTIVCSCADVIFPSLTAWSRFVLAGAISAVTRSDTRLALRGRQIGERLAALERRLDVGDRHAEERGRRAQEAALLLAATRRDARPVVHELGDLVGVALEQRRLLVGRDPAGRLLVVQVRLLRRDDRVDQVGGRLTLGRRLLRKRLAAVQVRRERRDGDTEERRRRRQARPRRTGRRRPGPCRDRRARRRRSPGPPIGPPKPIPRPPGPKPPGPNVRTPIRGP